MQFVTLACIIIMKGSVIRSDLEIQETRNISERNRCLCNLDNGARCTKTLVSFTYTSCLKGSVMLKIKMKVNDVIQAPKNKNTSMHVLSLI